jgi:hypothetical protein
VDDERELVFVDFGATEDGKDLGREGVALLFYFVEVDVEEGKIEEA